MSSPAERPYDPGEYADRSLPRRALISYQALGWHVFVRRALASVPRELARPVLRLYRARPRSFVWNGELLPQFHHGYNSTWENERAVEIPIVKREVDQTPAGERVLEIGCVLPHYFDVTHRVVDKYEPGRGVENVDILDFRDPDRFDLVVSISTLEHVGRDEEGGDDQLTVRAIEHVASKLLRPGGRFVATVPIGYNGALDRWLRDHPPEFAVTYLRRVDRRNNWAVCEPTEALASRYGWPYRAANAVAVLGFVAARAAPPEER